MQKDFEKRVDDKLKPLATEESVAERLGKKASAMDYGTIYKDIQDFRLSLGPLIERGWMLRKFIQQVMTFEINEVNTKDFYQRIEKLNSKIKDLHDDYDKELAGYTDRLSNAESACQAIREEIIELKIIMERTSRGKGLKSTSLTAAPANDNMSAM